MIKTEAIGRIGRDATVKEVNGRYVTDFSLAVNEKTVNPNTGEASETTTWINCSMWRDNMGKVWEYLKKGQTVYVEGKPSTRIYRKKDNTPGVDYSIRVDRVELIGGRPQADQSETGASQDWNWGDNGGGGQEPADDEAFWADQVAQDAEAQKAAAEATEQVKAELLRKEREDREKQLETMENAFD